MPSRYIRNTAILAILEVTYGVDPVPSGAANAMLVSNVQPKPLEADTVDRELIRPYFGASEQLVGTVNHAIDFDVELAGSGTAGTAPKWSPLIRACGFAEAVTAVTRVDYTPVSTAFESATIYWYDDGVIHRLTGARGTVSIKAGLSGRPVLSFSFVGIYNAPTATPLPAVTLTGFQKPLVITDANTGDITLGCTYAAGALVGGTAFPSQGIEQLDVGNEVNHIPLLGGESVDITGRQVTGKFKLDLTAAQEVTQMANVVANLTQGLGFVHGVTAGNIVLLHMPAAQLLQPEMAEIKGKRLVGFQFRAVPVAGNDELRICVK